MDSDTESDRPTEQTQTTVKSRRPPNTAFRQQRLKAWQPILTPGTVLPLFFGVMCLFALFGGLLLHASNEVQEIVIDYSGCNQVAPHVLQDISSDRVEYHFKDNKQPNVTTQWRSVRFGGNYTCRLQFDVPTEMGQPVYMFYRLTNFYQNHRRYVLSYNEDQLNGEAKTYEELKDKDDCKPLIANDNKKPYYPCGLIANSLFNDTFSSPVNLNTNEVYNMTNKGIAWSSDKNRFKKTKYNASQVVPPPNWHDMYPNGYTDENLPDISEMEEFQNWMRTAGLPTFSKLALRQDDKPLTPGTYYVDIRDNFDSTQYGGKKFLVLSTRTAIGGKNPFLGIAYIVVAGLCALLGVGLLIQHLVKPRRLGDHTYLSWNQETATATRQ